VLGRLGKDNFQMASGRVVDEGRVAYVRSLARWSDVDELRAYPVKPGVRLADIADITYRQLRDYGEGLIRDGLAHATTNRRMSAIGVALREAVRSGELEKRPELPHWRENNLREVYMTPNQEASLFGWLGRRVLAEQDMGEETGWAYVRALGAFLLDTGLRFSEAFKCRLSVPDAKAVVLDGADSKTGTGRIVPLTDRAQWAFAIMQKSDEHAELARDPNAWHWVSHRWNIATREAGCPEITLHILRHTCASRLVQRGVPIFTVSKWLGHKSVRVTERYAKLAPDSLQAALVALQEPLHGTLLLHDRRQSTDGGTLERAK
jgi:integrase